MKGANRPVNASRRKVLLGGLFGATGLGLRALATGVPAAFWANPAKAVAAGTCSTSVKPTYLVMSVSGAGDPIGNNAPGSYAGANIDPSVGEAIHPPTADFTGTTFSMNGNSVVGPHVWASLPQAFLDHLAVFHHSSYTDVHTDFPKVLEGMGCVANGEMFPSAVATLLAPCLNTVQAQPVNLSEATLMCQGASVPLLPPTSLVSVLGGPSSPLANLAKLRDTSLDQINAYLKQSGTQAQRNYLDAMAAARSQIQLLSGQLTESFASVSDNGPDSQLSVAVSLIRMNVSPVVVLHMNYGDDNHSDPGLAFEASNQVASVASWTKFYNNLVQFGLQDRVSFAMLNVFGRTFKSFGTSGRNHHNGHSLGLLMGPNVSGGIIGGIMPQYSEFFATPIDSTTGKAAPGGGDIVYQGLLGSYLQTISAAVGLTNTQIAQIITTGKPVVAALR